MRQAKWVAALVAACVASCGGSELDGSWRIESETIYDDAGSSTMIDPVTTRLELSGGNWQFGASSGAAQVAPIDDADWTRWGIDPYGPTRKLVLDGWQGSRADGPIEESVGSVDFLWVIAPEAEHATVWLKFSHL